MSSEQRVGGIGSIIMEKMGYRGGGLGKYGQGMSDPIKSTIRPVGMGLGYYEDTLPSKKLKYENMPLPEGGQVSESSKEHHWSKLFQEKNNSNKNKTTNTKRVTATEMLQTKQDHGFKVVQKVIDMRGPQVRVLTNLENLNAEDKERENNIHMPELRDSMRWMVDLAELDVQKIDHDLRNEQEIPAALQSEKERFEREASEQKKQIETMEDADSLLRKIDEQNAVGKLTLDSLVKEFGDMKRRHPDVYKIYDLSCVACSFSRPLFIRLFQGWNPLQNPTYGAYMVSIWKNLLVEEDIFEFDDAESPYTRLFMEVVFPSVRISATNTWQAKDPEPMLRFLETWEELVPPSVLQSILDNIVMPKLSSAVALWDPCPDTISIHKWMHPWLPLLGQKLENLHHTICNKLEDALHAWHPGDMFAYQILSPWKTVFDTISWKKLMLRSIFPKLVTAMHELKVDSVNQELDKFYGILIWATAIPRRCMIQLLDIFFDKWQLVLRCWLRSNPDFEKVRIWYMTWMEMIPQELLANNHVSCRIMLCLMMMDQAVEGKGEVPLIENSSYHRVLEQRKIEAQPKKAVPATNATTQMEDMNINLKSVIELYAHDNDVLFRPKPGRMYDGYQIYEFGKISIIVDSLNEKVLTQVKDRWDKVSSLKELLEMQSNNSQQKKKY